MFPTLDKWKKTKDAVSKIIEQLTHALKLP